MAENFVLFLSENSNTMITYKAIVIPGNRRKDGTYPVVIRVTYKGKSRRIATTLVAGPADLTRSLRIKNPTLLSKADAIISQMRDAASLLSPFEIADKDVGDIVTHIRSRLTERAFSLDFFEWSDSYIKEKFKVPNTKRAYEAALVSFGKYLGKRSIDINSISKAMLQDFMEKQPARYVVRLSKLFNEAKDKYNDEDAGIIVIPRSPFSQLHPALPPSDGAKPLSKEEMQRVISAKAGKAQERIALDVFILSFILMGVNLADLYEAEPVDGDEYHYYRKKTRNRRDDKAEMKVPIPPEARPYIERLRGEGGWWLNEIHRWDRPTQNVNKYLRIWNGREKAVSVEKFSFYSARHTWGTLARGIGIDKGTVADCMTHKGDYSVTDIYAERAWNVMAEANRKVLDLFDWGQDVSR